METSKRLSIRNWVASVLAVASLEALPAQAQEAQGRIDDVVERVAVLIKNHALVRDAQRVCLFSANPNSGEVAQVDKNGVLRVLDINLSQSVVNVKETMQSQSFGSVVSRAEDFSRQELDRQLPSIAALSVNQRRQFSNELEQQLFRSPWFQSLRTSPLISSGESTEMIQMRQKIRADGPNCSSSP